MKVSLFLFAALLATTFFSCKKNDDNKDCTLSEANLSGTYKIGAAKYKASASSPEVDAMSMVDECNLDDLETYKADHTVTYTDAGVKCGDPSDGPASWSLNGKTLTVGGDTGTITSFDCSGFTVTQSNFMKDGDSFIVTFTKQ